MLKYAVALGIAGGAAVGLIVSLLTDISLPYAVAGGTALGLLIGAVVAGRSK